MTKTSPSKRRGRPPGSKNKAVNPKVQSIHEILDQSRATFNFKKDLPVQDKNVSPWLQEISDLNKEINSLREKLAKAETIIDYLESKISNLLIDL